MARNCSAKFATSPTSILNFAQGKNGRGRGGMSTKLEAARIATEANGLAVIANGRIADM